MCIGWQMLLAMRRPGPEAPADAAIAAAEDAGLHWASDRRPGIARIRAGRGFTYRSPTGVRIAEPERLAWIRSLAIPPAWTDVWISPDRRGHILASGRDAKGRKQYRYHPAFRETRDATKFTRLIEFGERLPRIRRHVERDLRSRTLSRRKVLAAVVRLLDRTLIRVGNDEYARLNDSFGLTTLRNRHARVQGSRIRFSFRGKSGKRHDVGIRDRRLATLIRRLQDLPGQELFEYVDEAGQAHDIGSADVNAYLREISGGETTAKDFRTWAGTVLAYRALCRRRIAHSESDGRHQVADAVRDVAEHLGNTPAVCRGSYIHPAVLDAHLDGSLGQRLVTAVEAANAEPEAPDRDDELAVLRLLRERRRRDRGSRPSASTRAA